MNFAALKTEVQTSLIDTPPAIQQLTGSLVNRAIRALQRKHNFKDMQQSLTQATVEGQRLLVGRPSLWKAPRGRAYYVGELDGFHELAWITDIAQAQAMYGDNPDFDYGSPDAIVEDTVNSQFLVYPFPDGLSTYGDGEYRITLPYWGYTYPLDGDAATNWYTENAEEYIIFKAVSQGFFLNEDDSRGQLWDQRAERERQDVINADKNRYLAETDTLVPYTGANMPQVPTRWR